MTSSTARSTSKGEISHVHQRKSPAIKGFCDQSDPLRAKTITGMNLDGVGEVVSAQNDGDTSVVNQSGCDWEAVLHVF
jgi:hypothetical protein